MIRRFLTILCLFLAAALPAPAQEDAGPSSETFEVDALNPELGPVPDRVDRATPRATVDRVLDATREGDLDAAIHYLNVTDLAETPEPARAPRPVFSAARPSQLDRPDGPAIDAPVRASSRQFAPATPSAARHRAVSLQVPATRAGDAGGSARDDRVQVMSPQGFGVGARA